MPNLAGFDVVGELALDTVCDLIDRTPIQVGSADAFYLFGGPFLLQVPANSGNSGLGMLQSRCVASLDGVVGTSTTHLVLATDHLSTTFAGHTLSNITGVATVATVVEFRTDPRPHAGSGAVAPVLALDAAIASFVPDTAGQSAMLAALGGNQQLYTQLRLMLDLALTAAVRSLGAQVVPIFGFLVVHGKDSESPTTLTAMPQVSWIDPRTLGVFGIYRANGSGLAGNKRDSDIVQTGPEFVYVPDGVVSVLPARRMALLMSAEGFHLTVAGPIARGVVVPALLREQKIPECVATFTARDTARIRQQVIKDHFAAYFTAAMKTMSVPDAYTAAMAHVDADVKATIRAEAEQAADQWLATPLGIVTARLETPPDNGHGQVLLTHIDLPDPLAGLEVFLRHFSIVLADGHLALTVGAGGKLPVCGDWHMTQTGGFALQVDVSGTLGLSNHWLDRPDVNIDPDPVCEAALSAILAVFIGVPWGTLVGFGGITLATVIANSVAASLLLGVESDMFAKQTFAVPALPLPPGMQLKDITIEPHALSLVGLVARGTHMNDLRPRVELSSKLIGHDRARPADGGRMHLPATRWGCAAQDFDFVHQVFNSRFQLSLSTVALPLPLTVEQWQVDIGNHYVLLGSVRDPRPTWNNDFRTIVAPSITAAGDVWHPVPPTVGVMQRRDAMHIGVSGDAQSGWVLAFDGDDGCFDVRVTATVRAGDGVLYPGTTWFAVGGESVTFGRDYARYVADCQALFEQWFQDYMKSLHPRAGVGNVKPGTPFEHIEQLVANVVREAVNSGDAGAYGLMLAATARFGLGLMSALIGHRGGAAPHTTT